MNGISEILAEVLKINGKNKEIISAINEKINILLLEDFFEIAKIFFLKQNPHLTDFSLQDFMDQDSDGYFQKVIKGFCVGLEYLLEHEITETEKKQIYHILERREKIIEFINKNEKLV